MKEEESISKMPSLPDETREGGKALVLCSFFLFLTPSFNCLYLVLPVVPRPRSSVPRSSSSAVSLFQTRSTFQERSHIQRLTFLPRLLRNNEASIPPSLAAAMR